MFSASEDEHASSMGPTLKLHVMRGGGHQGSCLVAKQAAEFPQYWLVI